MSQEEIYIEKFDADSIDHEPIPFAQINRNVIQNIKNPIAGFIWVYLQSLPPTWKPNKFHIMKHFDISERTFERHIAFLREHRLIEHRRMRYKNGQLGESKLIVLNGDKFNNEPNIVKNKNQTAKNDGVVEKKQLPVDKVQKPNEINVFHHTAKKPRCGDLAVYINKQKNNINKKSNKSACFTNKVVDNFSKPTPKLKYLTREERLENEKHIQAREEKARREKEEEIKPFRRNGGITVLGNLFKGF